MTKAERDTHFKRAYNEAARLGQAAGEAARPTPMTVVGHGQRWHEPEGACGFAWVKVRPGTSAFARWLTKTGLADKAYRGGVQIWISAHDQSVDRKAAHARAMAAHLKLIFPELEIYAESRLD